jgi:hypothetical protein
MPCVRAGERARGRNVYVSCRGSGPRQRLGHAGLGCLARRAVATTRSLAQVARCMRANRVLQVELRDPRFCAAQPALHVARGLRPGGGGSTWPHVRAPPAPPTWRKTALCLWPWRLVRPWWPASLGCGRCGGGGSGGDGGGGGARSCRLQSLAPAAATPAVRGTRARPGRLCWEVHPAAAAAAQACAASM